MLESREAAKILENIVGPDNFSEDPSIISSYTFQPMGGGHLLGGLIGKDLFDAIEMGAVILPGSTEEVQAIVKVCNRYKIDFKALSTGIGAFTIALKPGSLQLDMRRMNRILKLDEKNMYAVVEPYVCYRELAQEAMKKGLISHISGAGSQTSVLANTTSYVGSGHTATTTGYAPRNYLGAEWVLPTGELLRWGLAEDGKVSHPGPGLIGVSRGIFGVLGALGVFTKVAVKLFPWPGPAKLELTGKNPNPGYKIPHNFRVRLLAMPNEEKLGDAMYKLIDAGVAYHVWMHPLFMHMQRWLGDSNDDHYEIWKKMKEEGIIEKSLNELTVVIAASSDKEMEYKEQVLNDIVNETGAEEYLPGYINDEVMEKFFCAQMAVHKPCTEFRTSGGDMENAWSQRQNLDSQMKIKKLARDIQKKYVDRGILMDLSGESCWGGPEEQRAMGHTEYINLTNPLDSELIKGQVEFIKECLQTAINEKLLGTGPGTFAGQTDRIMHAHLGGYFEYKRKIKVALDPNNVADPIMYLGAD